MSTELNESPVIRNLSDDLRAKALEYASALGARGPRPTTVLGTAVTLAKEWQSGRIANDSDGERGIALLVQPRGGRWVIRRANAPEPTHVFSVREDAVRRAQELAVVVAAPLFVFGPGGTLLERYAAPTPRHAAVERPAPRPQPRAVVERPVFVPRPVVLAPPPVAEIASEIKLLTPVVAEEGAPAAVAEATADAIVIAKNGRKWDVRAPNGTVETFTTRKKAAKVASDLATRLGLSVSNA